MNAPLPRHLSTVQALRGLAAMLVFFLHMAGMQRDIIGAGYREGFDGFWNRGFAGLDIFFVISGFIMVYVTRDMTPGLQSSVRFMRARLARIYPIWWIYAGLMALIYFIIFRIPATPVFADQVDNIWLYAVKSFLLIPQNVPPILHVGWTLILEMYFYIIFAVILILPRRFLIPALAIWAVQIVAFQLTSSRDPFMTVLRWPVSLEFIGGALVGLAIIKGADFKPKLILAAGIAAFATALFFTDVYGTMWRGFGRVLFFGLPTMAVIYGLVTLERTDNLTPPKWSIHLGDWSYSLYLGHIIVLLVMKNVWEVITAMGLPPALQVGAPGIADNILFAVVSTAAAIITAALSYILVERPLIRLFKRRRLKSEQKVARP